MTEDVSCTAFTLMPEFKLPTFKASGGETAIAPPAVAETPPADAGRIVVATTMDEWRFGATSESSVSLNPFWAVRRTTAPLLRRENLAATKQQTFNCSLTVTNITNICVGVVSGSQNSCTRIVEVPFLTNHVPVEKGEELLMQSTSKDKPPPQPATRHKTWRDGTKEIKEHKEAKKPKITA